MLEASGGRSGQLVVQVTEGSGALLRGAATRGAALADARVVGVSVVHGDLFAGLDVAQGEEGDLVAGDGSHVSVRLARVVDEGGRVAADGAVDGEVLAHPDDLVDGVLLPQPLLDAAVALDEFARVERDLLA